MVTAIFSHPECSLHEMGPGHPECPQRLQAINEHLRTDGMLATIEEREAPLASLRDLELAHSSAYTAELTALLEGVSASGTPRAIDPDTIAGAGTWRAALRAAGAAVAATDAVIDGEIDNAFCAVRPPGHHATHNQAMGFCFFNNVAVAARHALAVRGLQRVAIVDFDVHHGNGTEDIFAGDKRVLMVSIFQHPLFPYSGVEPLGTNMCNVAVPPFTRGAEVRALIEAKWITALASFKPKMIFISAGFDAHRDDPLGQLALVEADFAWITRRVSEVAQLHAQGRIVSCLEGGYALDALARSVAVHLRVLAGL
ncbi:MAG: histone deacetylase family protein [Burkholderiaceae bacterium]|nr:histone deacetylase family protein [Burkholderiaceae bacterium]MDH3459802.1 histone deacetylase family protein [Burkholderiaceae bacterium]